LGRDGINFLLRGKESDGLFFLSDWIFLVFPGLGGFFLGLGFSWFFFGFGSILVFLRFGFVGFLDLDIFQRYWIVSTL
jgi:hypothetical protein